jgi:drug/metabolite transporter superfamily protein YnfA
MLNGGEAVEGLETMFAVAIAVTAGAALVAVTQVSTSRSPAGIRESERAQAVVTGTSQEGIGTRGTADEAHRAAQASLGRQGIAAGFRQYGDQNESASRIFLFAGVLFFGASVGAALWLVTRLDEQATVASILTRAAISVPGAVVFAVFVRESAARRRYAAWGGLIAIQAEHLGSFIADMTSAEAREELEMQFGRAVFRGGDVALERTGGSTGLTRQTQGSEGNESGGTTMVPLALVTELLALATSAAGVVKSAQDVAQSSGQSRTAP